MSQIVVRIPQTDLAGLSENWLFKDAGDRHWLQICKSSRIAISDLVDEQGNQLYPTFVAVRARYSSPLNAIALNASLWTSTTLAHYGSLFFESRITYGTGSATFKIEMLSAFVSRASCDNELRKGVPTLALRPRAMALKTAPKLLKLGQCIRRGDWAHYHFDGQRLPSKTNTPLRSPVYEPSPYTDFNGVGMLYFAAYPTITDTLERQTFNQRRIPCIKGDWALATSTVARDIFYHRNLPLGARLYASIEELHFDKNEILMHTCLLSTKDGARLADIITRKMICH